MKKLFFCLLGGAMMLNSCTDDSGIFVPDGIKEPTLPVETKPNEVVKGDVFSKLNLDYPGLEKVKQHYEAGEHYLAAKELLEYYRWRSNVVNPFINTFVTASTVDLNKANEALEYRFCVANYVEKENTSAKDDDVYYNFKKDDGTINWGWKPDNSSVDREFYYQQHRHQWMEPQAKAYAATKNEAYFNNWVDVYSSWMSKYPCPNKAFVDPNIKDLEEGYEWKALQPTERVLSQMNVIQYYLISPNFTPEWLSVVMNAFAESVEMIRMNYIEDGNIRVSQGQAVASAGILFPEFKNAEEWIKEGIKTMDTSIQFRKDGVHVDLDFGYHISAITDYLEVYKLAKANNRLDIIPAGYLEQLRNAAHFVADMIYPDYTVDNFNDTHSSTYNRSDVDPKNSVLQNRFRDYLEVFPDDQELLWLAWDGKKGGTKPSWKSKAYTDAGYYMFRSKDWAKDQGIMMIHKNNNNPPAGEKNIPKWHCQPDNGTFSLWYKGVNFLPDAGSYSYDDDGTGNTPRDKYRRSTLHNTMSVFTKDIYENRQLGKFIYQGSTEDYEVIVTENTPYEKGVVFKGDNVGNKPNGDIIHRRSIFFVKEKFFVLLDEAYSKSNLDKQKINLNFHLLSEEKDKVQAIVINDPSQSSDKSYALAKTDLTGSSLLIKSFADTKGSFKMEVKKKSEDVEVSNQPGVVIGNKRDWLLVHLAIPEGNAARLITVLYPSDVAAGDGKNISAEFIHENGETAGTFNPNGAAVKVRVDGQDYELKYTLQ